MDDHKHLPDAFSSTSQELGLEAHAATPVLRIAGDPTWSAPQDLISYFLGILIVIWYT